jgi:hypothetical protein
VRIFIKSPGEGDHNEDFDGNRKCCGSFSSGRRFALCWTFGIPSRLQRLPYTICNGKYQVRAGAGW